MTEVVDHLAGFSAPGVEPGGLSCKSDDALAGQTRAASVEEAELDELARLDGSQDTAADASVAAGPRGGEQDGVWLASGCSHDISRSPSGRVSGFDHLAAEATTMEDKLEVVKSKRK